MQFKVLQIRSKISRKKLIQFKSLEIESNDFQLCKKGPFSFMRRRRTWSKIDEQQVLKTCRTSRTVASCRDEITFSFSLPLRLLQSQRISESRLLVSQRGVERNNNKQQHENPQIIMKVDPCPRFLVDLSLFL